MRARKQVKINAPIPVAPKIANVKTLDIKIPCYFASDANKKAKEQERKEEDIESPTYTYFS